MRLFERHGAKISAARGGNEVEGKSPRQQLTEAVVDHIKKVGFHDALVVIIYQKAEEIGGDVWKWWDDLPAYQAGEYGQYLLDKLYPDSS
jgi:hypothetical protein